MLSSLRTLAWFNLGWSFPLRWTPLRWLIRWYIVKPGLLKFGCSVVKARICISVQGCFHEKRDSYHLQISILLKSTESFDCYRYCWSTINQSNCRSFKHTQNFVGRKVYYWFINFIYNILKVEIYILYSDYYQSCSVIVEYHQEAIATQNRIENHTLLKWLWRPSYT